MFACCTFLSLCIFSINGGLRFQILVCGGPRSFLKVKNGSSYLRGLRTAGLPCYREPLCAFLSVLFILFSFVFFHLRYNTLHKWCTTVSSPPATGTVPFILFPGNITNALTPWSRDFLDNLISLQLVKKLSAFYGARRTLLCLQEATTCPHPRPDHSRPRHPILFV
jgi:hypothetical protein